MNRAKDTWFINWHDYFMYDETSPTFLRWNINTQKVSVGDVAGTICAARSFVKLHQQRYNAARIIYEMKKGPLTPRVIVDHIDGNPSNNHHNNLRAVTHELNSRNMSKSKRNKSGVKGVCKQAVIDRDGITVRYYWTAGWRCDGKYFSKAFSVAKLGDSQAFDLACRLREAKLRAMNEVGAGYTERHLHD